MAQDLYRYFRLEARELLEQLGRGMLDLEKHTGPPELVPRLLRLTHTLKGAARVVRQREIADQSHAIEGELTPFREAAGDIPRDRIETVMKLLDGIGSRVAVLALPADAEAATGKPVVEETLQTVRADIAEIDVLLNGIAETHTQMRSLRSGLGSVKRARRLADLLAERHTPRRWQETARSAAGDTTHAMAEELRAIFGGFERTLALSLDQMDRELLQVRGIAEQLRLVPAGTLFPALELTARDAARALRKRVVFAGRGGDVRLDAHVLGALQGGLLQIVRNAVAHGIESPADRMSAGKAADGQVTLEVSRRGRRLAFRCIDDGLGVDLEAVRRAAQRKGASSSEIEKLDAEALLRLLLRGGISTSGAVTEVSGRGIGLDLAREAVERLGGEISVRTEAGKGTTVELLVPLSIAALDAIVVESSGSVATIPLDTVRRTLRVAAEDVFRTAQGESVLHEGKVIPFVSLSRLLHPGTVSARDARSWSAAIVEGAGGAAAIGVDRFLGTASIVLRPLPDLVPPSAVVAGVSLDAEGNPQLVLDSDNLVMEAEQLAPVIGPAPPHRPRILVIDDSLTTRMLEQSILESADFEVGLAASAEEALETALRRRYALFLVDVEMPGMDGFTFIERARADPLLRDVPAILVTSRVSLEDRQRGKEVGAQGYIVKSEFDQAGFLEQVRRLVR